MTIRAPYLPYDALRTEADKFLAKDHSLGPPPVPIDHIVEFQLEMDIVPVPGLHRSFEVDSALSNDLVTIYVDDFVFKKRLRRYHFSLAHEVSHKLIHREVFSELRFANLSEWKAAIASIPPQQYSLIEWQAYSLARLILVPAHALAATYAEAEQAASEAGVALSDLDDHAKRIVCDGIGESFGVSADVILKRMKYDKIWQ